MSQPDTRSRRWLRYTLGSLLAFIAGMAVMLAVMLPFLPVDKLSQRVANPHAVGAMTPQARCMTCHATPNQMPTTQAVPLWWAR